MLKHAFIMMLFALMPMAAQAQVSIPGKQAFDFEVEPGNVYEGSFMVRNTSDQPQQARLYQTDYTFEHDGQTLFDEPGTLERSNARWVEFSPSVITIPAGETIPVHYKVKVPGADAQGRPLDGSYWSLIMVEGIGSDLVASASDPKDNGMSMRVVTRYGVQVATHVQGTKQPAINFDGVNLVQHEGEGRSLSINVENMGNTMVEPRAWIELYDKMGVMQQRIEGKANRIYPETSVRYEYDLANLPKGQYEALVVFDLGAEEVYGAQYSLSL